VISDTSPCVGGAAGACLQCEGVAAQDADCSLVADRRQPSRAPVPGLPRQFSDRYKSSFSALKTSLSLEVFVALCEFNGRGPGG